MSKRFIFPQQNGERKKAKLDFSISDHNFPLSQNSGPSKESNQADTWGDDNDDEILLLASQACEQACNDDTSILPDYSLCMQPGTTSTQYDPGPSTSKASFMFKKPSAVPSNIVSTNLKDKCSRISSPLPGISSKVTTKVNEVNISDDLIFNDKVYKGDADYVYKQLLQFQEENAKLKSENGKLLEKCVTKEGEASILRSQLKTCQATVDNARLERIKAQEKAQMEWMEKLTAANGQVHDLRTQLDFKNLEIISIKEKCRMLESNKIKLTQVTVANNDISSSHRNLSINESLAPLPKRVKTISIAAQTDDKAHFIKLNKSFRIEQSQLSAIFQVLLQPTTEHDSLLEYNEKLQKQTDLSRHKCRIYNTFHRVPSTPVAWRDVNCKVDLKEVYEELTFIVDRADTTRKRFSKVLTSIKTALQGVQSDLQAISQKMTTAFQKEMDEKYIDTTNTYHVIEERDLISGKALYKEEQSILARRMVAILPYLLPHANIDAGTFRRLDKDTSGESRRHLVDILNTICDLLDSTSCAIHYSGLLLAITPCISHLQQYSNKSTTLEIIKHLISSRPLLPVANAVLVLIRNIDAEIVNELCPRVNGGNLKLDYDQGVLLYKKDSCYIQVLLKQIEAALKCIEKQNLRQHGAMAAQNLIEFYASFRDNREFNQEKVKCDCQLVLMQVLVYALRICAAMLDELKRKTPEESCTTELLAICRGGTQILYHSTLRDVEFSSQLGYNEGHLIEFCETLKTWECNGVYSNMLSEISGTFQSSPEDMTSSFNKQPWLKSFDNFSIVD